MKPNGFTLSELLVTLAILGILASVAYPHYTDFIAKTHRTQAQQNLMLLAKDMEQYYAEKQSYIGANLDEIAPATIVDSTDYHYQIQEVTDTSYELAAVPMPAQAAHDSGCGTLLFNQLGEESNSGANAVADCWQA
jgi:type IV pilus assembly protein PilE